MARPGVTFSEVDRAARKVLEQGQRPTVDRVIAITGGSRTTVNAHLKLWWAKHDQQVDAEQAGLPAPLVEAVKALSDKAHETAEHKIMEAKTRFEAEAARLRQEASNQRARAEQSETLCRTLQEQLTESIANIESLKQVLEQEKLARVRLEAEVASTASALKEARAIQRERQDENRDIRAHFEHYQQRIAEDRQQEREQFRITRTSLEQQVDLLSKQLQMTEQRRQTMQTECEKLRELQEKSDAVVEELTHNLSLAEAQNATLERRLAQQDQTLAQWHRTLENILAQHQQLQTEHQQACQQQAAKEQKTHQWEQQCKECRDRVMLLADENRILLQEKALLQGQLKQLQNTL